MGTTDMQPCSNTPLVHLVKSANSRLLHFITRLSRPHYYTAAMPFSLYYIVIDLQIFRYDYIN